ncbi:activator-dependent family glycosyltransferase [Micromonospora sp. SH-82]|uniref:activator-dependent family glycosyltransferase n=1 Tax=Micromonospora sp. SH-82 TaxID=3132938 RepID=UPI003EB7A936
MRVVFSSMAVNSHLFGLVPLASAFQAAGHEVRVVSSPALTDDVTGAGLTAVPVGDDVELVEWHAHAGQDIVEYMRTLDWVDQSHTTMSWDDLLGMQTTFTPTFFALMSPDSLIDGMVEFCRSWRPDLIVWEPLTFAAPIAARVTGTPHARMLWGPDVATRARQSFLRLLAHQEVEHREDPLAEWFDWTLRRFGDDPHLSFDEELVLGQWTVDPIPEPLRIDTGARTVGMRYVPYNGPSVVPDWLLREPGRRRVCLTLGGSSREHGIGQVSIGEMLDAIADIDAEFVATFDDQQLAGVGTVPANVRTAGFVPMNVLLPTCAATVHHGGTGSWLTAAIHGVPQIILSDADTEVHAKQLQDLGAGLSLPVAGMTAEHLRTAIERVLDDPAYRLGAERMRDGMRTDPSPAQVVGICQDLAADRAARGSQPRRTAEPHLPR